MESLLALCFVLLALVVIGVIARQAITGKRPLLCIRNVFLAGVLIFQLSSAATSFHLQHYGELAVGDPVGSGFKFLGIITTFLILFFVVYETGWFTFHIQDRIRIRTPIPGTGALVVVSLACAVVSAVFEIPLRNLGLIGTLAELFGGALASMAAGTAAWAWARSPRNLPLLLFMLSMVAVACALSVFDSFGRRALVCVLVAALWGVYHGGFKHVSMRRAAIPLTVIGLGSFLLVAAFTSTRGEKGKGVGIVENFTRLANANIGNGISQLLAGQDAAGNSLWVIENNPEPFPYEPLGSLVYMLVNPVPRIVWDDKPIGLGSMMVTQSMVTGKGSEYSVGAGLVGHLVHDNLWLSIWLYPILLGSWMRILDDMPRRYPTHPYVLLPLGISLGEILGIARGEMGFFLFRGVWGMTGAFFATLVLARVLRSLGFSFAPPPGDEPSEELHYALDADE